MGIEDPAPNTAIPDPLAPQGQAPARPAPPAWADESTVLVPLAELFADDVEE